MKSNLTTQERFATIESTQISRSQFDRSFGHKTTVDAGKLYPIYWDLAIPGDTFKVKPTIFGRFATPLKPIMDNVYVDMHFFSVPYRLVMDDFQKLMGEQKNPGDSTNFTIPMMSPANEEGYPEQSIYDYLGLPTKQGNKFEHSSLPLRAYNLIFNEWYRDENLQDWVPFNTGNETDPESMYTLLWRNKRKDYFTSMLPWAQKSQPVNIPLVGQAPVYGKLLDNTLRGNLFQSHNGTTTRNTGLINTNGTGQLVGAGLGNTFQNVTLGAKEDYDAAPSYNPPYADLTDVSAITVNAFREAVAFQQFFELDARGGTRYTETIKAHFNVTSPDARLQRPEYLGGGSTPLTITPVVQNSASQDDQTPQGNLAGLGTISMSQQGFTKTFTEHEIILGIMSIRADLNYQQGLNRLWSQKTRYDFYWPTFNNIGEQAVKNKELYVDGETRGGVTAEEWNEQTAGYAERYSEYRFRPSQITGLFRSNATQSLDVWHLAQELAPRPALNEEFIKENPPIDRVIAVTNQPQFIIDAFFDNIAARPMPVRSNPGLTRL